MGENPQSSKFLYLKKIFVWFTLNFKLINSPQRSMCGKNILNNAVHKAGESQWSADLESKSSLKYVNPHILKTGKYHRIWATVRNSVNDSRRAQFMCRLLTGTYILQGNRAASNQYAVDSTCQLCLCAPETRQHFICECIFLEPERCQYKDETAASKALIRRMRHDCMILNFLYNWH